MLRALQVKLSISGEAIAQLFALFKDSLQCVVLNACYSKVQVKAISEYIPFVIGMSDEIDDKAVIEFAVAVLRWASPGALGHC